MLGNYYNVMRFMINREVNYDYGFMIVCLYTLGEEEKAQSPSFHSGLDGT